MNRLRYIQSISKLPDFRMFSRLLEPSFFIECLCILPVCVHFVRVDTQPRSSRDIYDLIISED